MCDSSAQSGNGSSTLAAASESLTIASSVDGSAGSQQDNVAEVARQVGPSWLVTMYTCKLLYYFLQITLQHLLCHIQWLGIVVVVVVVVVVVIVVVVDFVVVIVVNCLSGSYREAAAAGSHVHDIHS